MSALSRTNSGSARGRAFVKNVSTTVLPEDQFDACCTRFSKAAASAQFKLEFSSWEFGDVVLTRTLYGEAPVRHRRHRSRPHLCVVLAHPASPDPNSIFPQQRQGNLGYRSLAMQGQAEDMEVLTLFLPQHFCQEELADFGGACDLELNPELRVLLADYLENLARQLPHISAKDAQGIAAATLSLVAACIVPRGKRSITAKASFPLIERARAFIRQNMASPEFGPGRLADLMAMSRSKLYRLFQNAGGVVHFINHERLIEAHRRLISRNAPSIHVISDEVGFVDHSTFSRAFRRQFGYSPTEACERASFSLTCSWSGEADRIDRCLQAEVGRPRG
ncbi:helix-turn-helix transcriptional regulator [Bosea sp. 2RAB26]|uniref:helix-turn-helix transcriptional regulator n=1 Tax=Bosea sp. 2RAB26 TaxID=3237476 RepID=UPI003F929C0C